MIETVAVLGSGTMGAGIAQAALGAGLPVLLYDVDGAALEHARARIAAGLQKQSHADAIEQLRLVTALDELRSASLVIEAAPEQLDLKRELLAQVGALCPAPTIIASNTSSLPIAALASACPAPERVAGLHFFNPVHRMALVEVVRAAQTNDATIATLRAFAAQLGKTPVLARDTPGFIVNRVARPFYGEALRLLGEGIASCATVDMALQQAGGFPLGPFALMDLIGIDVNFDVTTSMYEQAFGEPRYRPHPIQQQKVLAGQLGRKTGQGFYGYENQEPRIENQNPPDHNSSSAVAHPSSAVIGTGTWAPTMTELLTAAGWTLLEELPYGQINVGAAFVVAGRDEGAIDQTLILDRTMPAHVPLFAQCVDVMASELAMELRFPERLVGYDGLFTDNMVTLVATPKLGDETRTAAEMIVRGLGREPVWIEDGPGLVVPRVVAMLANEAAFAVGEGVAEPEAIDTAMRLGMNHPTGPLARAKQIGYDKIVAILDHVRTEYGEERYRVAPRLRRAVRLGML
ncbi:MAG TPA: 3-hydroxyacyl-CoA dehydrogenase NAD-binding domain-containing protein [Roseiflexaceae bacterium]|nr:3-hydroxyacyl-CoA dehydrogenase NAD-binding domain-containing protein [Roseiflexaceae bacterium]